VAIRNNKKRRETDYSRTHSTVRLSREVKDYITEQATYNESIDQTLRRIFQIDGKRTPSHASGKGASR
jgi:hypothetical protein